MKIKEILLQSINKLNENHVEDSSSKARRLLAFVLDVKKEYLIINDSVELSQKQEEKYNKYIDEIIEGKPIQYILGYQEFMGIKFKVNENVLIPQPDTEILVEKTLEIAKKFDQPRILDLCTGSGAIAISLDRFIPQAQITASDISKKALEIAQSNDDTKKIKFIHSDMFENIKETFDIIVSNPPYIKTDVIKTLSKEVQNEPHLALDGGEDGLDFYKEIINNGYKYLNKNGYLCLEIGEEQKKIVVNLIETFGNYTNIETLKDLGDNDRVIICQYL